MIAGVPSWVISAAAAGAIGFFAGWSWNGARHDAERASEKVEAVQEVRTEETRRTETIEKVVQDAAPKLEAIRDDADAARDELDGLRRTADQYARRLASCSATAERSEATTRAAMVLSDLLSRSEARNVELAAAFDDARERGLTCQAAYQALRPDSRSSSTSMPR